MRRAAFSYFKMKVRRSRWSFSFCFKSWFVNKLMSVLLFNGISTFHLGMLRTLTHAWLYENVFLALSTTRFFAMSEGTA